MAKKKQDATEETADSALVAAAKTVGAVAGKVAATLGVTAPKEPTPPTNIKKPKLAPKNKSRLPRKLKKAQRARASK